MNDILVPERTPEIIAAEINSIKNQTQKIMLQASIEIGKRLTEAKAAVGHGNWGEWLKSSVDYSERTASNLMRIFSEYGDGQEKLFGVANQQAFASLNYTQAIALLGIKDEDDRAEFIEKNDIDSMSTRELQQAIKERDAAKAVVEQMSEETKEAKENYQKAQEELEAAKNREQDLIKDTVEADKKIKMIKAEKAEAEKRAAELEEKLNAAPGTQKDSGNDDKLQVELGKMKDKVSSLKAKLKAAEDLQKSNVDKIPEETQKEMQSLREQLQQAKDNPREQAILKYRIYFENIKEDFGRLIESLEEIEDDEIKEKYRGATTKALDILRGKLEARQ